MWTRTTDKQPFSAISGFAAPRLRSDPYNVTACAQSGGSYLAYLAASNLATGQRPSVVTLGTFNRRLGHASSDSAGLLRCPGGGPRPIEVVIEAREVTKQRVTVWLCTVVTLEVFAAGWDALLVHPSTGVSSLRPRRVPWGMSTPGPMPVARAYCYIAFVYRMR
jgi:hypothetical protein